MGSRRWSIRTRLVVAFLGVLIPYLGLAGIGMVALRAILQSVSSIHVEVTVEQKSASDVERARDRLENSIKDYLAAGDPAQRPQLDQAVARYREAFARLEPTLFHDAQQRHLAMEVRKHEPEIETLLREIQARSDARPDRGVLAAARALHRRFDQMAPVLDQIQAIATDEMGEDLRSISSTIRRTALAGLAALVLSVAGGVAIALVSSTWLSRPILALAQGSRQMAEGDLSQRVKVDAGGELGEAARAFNEMAARLEASYATLAMREADLQRRHGELAALVTANQAIASSLDLDRVLRAIVREAIGISASAAVRLFLLDQDSKALRCGVAAGLPPEAQETHEIPVGVGFTGQVAATRAPLAIADTRGDSRILLPEHAIRYGLVSYLGLPVQQGERLFGVLVFNANAPHAYTPEEIAFLSTFAQQAALAIGNARLHEAAVRRGEELGALLRASRSVMAGLDIRATIDQIIREASQMAGTPHVKVLLVDKEAQVLRLRAVAGRPGWLLEGFQMPLGTGLSGLVAETGRPLFVPDCHTDPRNIAKDQDRELGLQTYLGLPIAIRDVVLGVLTFNTEGPRQYSPEELAYLASFADQAAIAIENARLHEALQREAAELEDRVRERTAELEKALRVKAEFLATISHELRTPLTGILGFSELLLGRGSGELTSNQERFLQQIHTSGQRLLDLVTDILDFAQAEVGASRLHLEPIALEPVLHAMVDLFQGPATRKRLALTTALDPGLPPVVADRGKLTQILVKLLNNAVKFTPDGGRITVRARRVPGIADFKLQIADLKTGPVPQSEIFNLKSEIEYLEIAVTDTGIGMAPENLERIFRGFAQVDSSDTRPYEGAGLGLALVRLLVELHGGRVWAESEGEGRGARFIVRLPLLPAPPVSPA